MRGEKRVMVNWSKLGRVGWAVGVDVGKVGEVGVVGLVGVGGTMSGPPQVWTIRVRTEMASLAVGRSEGSAAKWEIVEMRVSKTGWFAGGDGLVSKACTWGRLFGRKDGG